MTETSLPEYTYPRRKFIRRLLKAGIDLALSLLGDIKIIGEENIPRIGPLLVISNHFSFLDPVALIRIAPWPMDFIGGFETPYAPKASLLFPKLWGTLKVRRGRASTDALTAAQSIISQNGILGIFPEGGSWAAVLRPPRPGTALLAMRTGACILPVGLDGFTTFFPTLKKGKRPQAVIRIGKPFGPFSGDVRGRADRPKMEAAGHEMMKQISVLLPPEVRGFYSDDPAIRAAAQGSEIYPWELAPEG